MRILTTTNEGVTFLYVSGEVDLSVADELRNAGLAALSPLTGTLRIDLSGVTFMDSSALGALVMIRNAAADHHTVVVENAQPQVHRVLKITGLDQVFESLKPQAV